MFHTKMFEAALFHFLIKVGLSYVEFTAETGGEVVFMPAHFVPPLEAFVPRLSRIGFVFSTAEG